MTEEKTTRELVYETNRDVKWICKMLQRMEAQDEEFEARIRALEGWRAEKAGEERRVSTISAGAGGVVADRRGVDQLKALCFEQSAGFVAAADDEFAGRVHFAEADKTGSYFSHGLAPFQRRSLAAF